MSRSRPTPDRRRVAVVTGGGGGIGAAIAEELGRTGAYVVTVDPLVTLDGAERVSDAEVTTAERIVAAGGAARASSASVTDLDALVELFAELTSEMGGVDVVVNVAGITRPSGFGRGDDEDWRSVLSVHLDGYRNVLAAALPIMAAAGHGHVLGVTSGSGWRAADTGAYGCAKRAVASLTWQLGRAAPPGVVVNAISPIAMTRMVAAAMARQGAAARASAPRSGSSATGGLSLGAMPGPEQLGPLAAHLVGPEFDTCNGRVLFAAGSEVAVVDEPRLLEVIASDSSAPLGAVLDAAIPVAFASAEQQQATCGGSNPRIGSFGEIGPAEPAEPAGTSCAVLSDRPELAASLCAALEARGVRARPLDTAQVRSGFDAPSAALSALDDVEPLDAVVIALSSPAPSDAAGGGDWQRVLEEHSGLVDRIHTDAAWVNAVTELAARAGRPVRAVTLTDATTAGGRSRAQAAAQLARAALGATDQRVSAFAVGIEVPVLDATAVAELAAHLVTHPDAEQLSGAELTVGAGTIGLRSHPRAGASVLLGEATIPPWFDEVLGGVLR